MIQPTDAESRDFEPDLYTTGCAGRITDFSETDDDQYLITLTGVTRFDIDEEIECSTLYRQVKASYDRFEADGVPPPPAQTAMERGRLIELLRDFLGDHGVTADWEAVDRIPDHYLVDSLACVCPFEPRDKQALLEAADTCERERVLFALLEMGLAQSLGSPQGYSH